MENYQKEISFAKIFHSFISLLFHFFLFLFIVNSVACIFLIIGWFHGKKIGSTNLSCIFFLFLKSEAFFRFLFPETRKETNREKISEKRKERSINHEKKK
jgi:hypothetical protein